MRRILQASMALTARKGHAASVRRQSRQRLRSERRYIFLSRSRRRYRRNRSVRFYRHLVRTGSAFPRLPRPLWGLAMTRQGSAAMGTVRHTESAVLLPLRGRAGHAPPLQGQYGLNGGRRMIHSSFFILQYSLFLISSIPLRGMANHMTKRPEIPCLSCKFPQSRRICH